MLTTSRDMKIKEIHDYLLSLLIRSLGIWVLYLSLDNLTNVASDIYLAFVPDPPRHPDWSDVYFLGVKLLMAAYFILGAPPFLKWATREKDVSS